MPNLGSALERVVSTSPSWDPLFSSPGIARSVPLAGLVPKRYRRIRDDPGAVVLRIVDLRRAVREDAFTVVVVGRSFCIQ